MCATGTIIARMIRNTREQTEAVKARIEAERVETESRRVPRFVVMGTPRMVSFGRFHRSH